MITLVTLLDVHCDHTLAKKLIYDINSNLKTGHSGRYEFYAILL